MSKDLDEIEQLIDDCETREDRLSDWERRFIDSIAKQYAQRRSLTDKQKDRLDEVWEKATAGG
jgi:hypothetical protein